jgi:hypothetical protein
MRIHQFPNQKPEATLKLSMHAVKGSSNTSYTFTLTAMLGSYSGTVLVDSGSTWTLIMTPELAQKSNCKVIPNKTIKFMVANGG